MQRRHFITNGLMGLGALTVPFPTFDSPTGDGSVYRLANRVEAPDLPLPAGMRLPFGWEAFGVQGEAVRLSFPKPAGHKTAPALFRVSTAVDVREAKLIDVFLPVSGRKLGTLDIRYAPVFQPFGLALSAEDTEAVFREGIALKQTQGKNPIWFFQPVVDTTGASQVASNQALLPHLLFETKTRNPTEAFYANFLSLNSIQTFGWMEGCVLDGLLDLHRRFPEKKIRPVMDAHLRLFFDANRNLIYEGPYSRPHQNTFYGIEALLPFATLAQLDPAHPILPAVAAYCVSKANSRGLIQDQHLTTEGCYTIAYPLAAMAVALQQKDLARRAIDQLVLRREALVSNEHIHQRLDENGQLHFPSWARGVAWYLLGTARTLTVLDQHKEDYRAFADDIAKVKEEFVRASQWALARQNTNGLWFCFLDKSGTEIDTSGSAGIAAALAIGARNGYLPASVQAATAKTRKALLPYLTPDGFLTGVAQANKGGIALQEGGYRVISQYASGLMAQLIAAQSAEN